MQALDRKNRRERNRGGFGKTDAAPALITQFDSVEGKSQRIGIFRVFGQCIDKTNRNLTVALAAYRKHVRNTRPAWINLHQRSSATRRAACRSRLCNYGRNVTAQTAHKRMRHR